MATITTWVRVITASSLGLALILTVFLLSGTTSSGTRALYNTELKYDTENGTTSPLPLPPSTSTSASSSSSSSSSSSTSTLARPTITHTTVSDISRVPHRVTPTPYFQQFVKRVPATAPQTARATILISYYGICTYNTAMPWQCASHRTKNGTSIPGGAPPDILALAASLQGALSPIPAIFSILSLGTLLTYTILLSFLQVQRSSITSLLAQAYLFLALVTLAWSLFTAVLFQASSTITYAVFSTSSSLAASKSVAGLAVSWAAVFFTCLAVAGAAFQVFLATQHPEGMRQNALALVERVFGHSGSVENGGGGQENIHPALRKPISHPTPPREAHLGPGPFREDGAVRGSRRRDPPFIGGWNMI